MGSKCIVMTLQEYVNKIRTLAETGSQQAINSVIEPAANELLAVTKNRIINEGKSGDDTQIGVYDKKAGYYSKKQFINKSGFKAVGQRGYKGEKIAPTAKAGVYKVVKTKTIKNKDGKTKRVSLAPKSMYLPEGYYQFRALNGRENDKVNMVLSGDTMQRYQLELTNKSVIMGMTTQKAAKIRQGNDRRFATNIFAPSKEDIDVYAQQVTEGFRELITQAFAD